MKGCYFCGIPIYMKAITHTKSLLAPATRAEELKQQLHDLTGEVYVLVDSEYCPLCGKKLKELQEK